MSLHLIIFDRGSLEVVECSQLRQAKKKAPMIKWDMKICLFDLADENIRRKSAGAILLERGVSKRKSDSCNVVLVHSSMLAASSFLFEVKCFFFDVDPTSVLFCFDEEVCVYDLHADNE